MNDPRLERARTAGLADGLAAGPPTSPAVASVLAQTTTGGVYPGLAAAAYLMAPVQADGGATEGAAFTLAVDPSRRFLAVNLGNSIPPEGTTVTCHRVGGRWCFEHGEAAAGPAYLSWSNVLSGSGAVPLIPDGANAWRTPCFNEARARLTFDGSNYRLIVTAFAAGGCMANGPNTSCASDSADPERLILIQRQDNPLFVRWSVTAGGCPVLNQRGYSNFTVTG